MTISLIRILLYDVGITDPDELNEAEAKTLEILAEMKNPPPETEDGKNLEGTMAKSS